MLCSLVRDTLQVVSTLIHIVWFIMIIYSNSDFLQYNIDHLYIPRRKEIYILWNILRAHLWKSAFHARLPGHLRSLHMRLPQPSDTKSGLILDGFIRKIGRRQKSFDVRHKFFWYQPSKINQLWVNFRLFFFYLFENENTPLEPNWWIGAITFRKMRLFRLEIVVR